jgi:hypothetical protein
MLVAYRLAGLSALETYYARARGGAQFGPPGVGQLGATRTAKKKGVNLFVNLCANGSRGLASAWKYWSE